MAEVPAYPWLLLDPDLGDWGGPVTEDTIEAAEALRDYFSVLIGELDLCSIIERASVGCGQSYVVLREALASGAVRTRGLSLDEPDAVIGGLGGGVGLDVALLDATRNGAMSLLGQTRCSTFHSADALLSSRYFRKVLKRDVFSCSRPGERSRLWAQVLEPFARTKSVNIYETYLFQPLLGTTRDLERGGLHWLLGRFFERSESLDERMTVYVRGTFRDRGRRRHERRDTTETQEELDKIRINCERLIEEFGSRLNLRLEVVDGEGRGDGKPAHDRFWLGRSGNSATRVMFSSNSIIQHADRHAQTSVPRTAAAEVDKAYNISWTSDPSSLRVYERLWLRQSDFVVLTCE